MHSSDRPDPRRCAGSAGTFRGARPPGRTVLVEMVLLVVAAAFVAGACVSSGGGQGASGGPGTTIAPTLRVAVTTSILADIVRQVGGDRVEVVELVPEGTDPAAFEPGEAALAEARRAALLVAFGGGLEAGLAGVEEAARAGGAGVVELVPRLAPQPMHTGPGPDPHVWLDPDRMTRAERIVVDELVRRGVRDPGGLRASADRYADVLARADEEVQRQVARIPEERKLLVSSTDVLGYFADRYGFRVVGAVDAPAAGSQGGSGEGALVAAMREDGDRAVFTDATDPPDRVERARQVAAGAGPGVHVVELATQSLGSQDPESSTYAGMLTSTSRALADSL